MAAMRTDVLTPLFKSCLYLAGQILALVAPANCEKHTVVISMRRSPHDLYHLAIMLVEYDDGKDRDETLR